MHDNRDRSTFQAKIAKDKDELTAFLRARDSYIEKCLSDKPKRRGAL